MPDSKFGFVDHVVYINLDHRTDRREHIEASLAPYFLPEKVTRISAIQRDIGAIGCTESHIAVMEMARANQWKNVLVLEDDAMWTKDFNEAYPVLERLAGDPSYDVIMLSSTFTRWYGGSLKLISGKTSSAYLVNSHYYDTLLSNFKEGLKLFEVSGENGKHAIDTYWCSLQERDNWFVVTPNIVWQRPGYSDIIKEVVNYRLEGSKPHFEFVERVVYINLDKRTERRTRIEAELAPFFKPEKVTRFKAIERDSGILGCMESHIAVLEMAKANQWKNVLVLEDDAVWETDFESAYDSLTRLVESHYDCIVFGGHNTRWDEKTFRLIRTFGAEAYLIRSHYYDTLLANFKEAKALTETHGRPWDHAHDVHMNRLFCQDSWYAVVPGLMKQLPGYSDIRKEDVKYTRD